MIETFKIVNVYYGIPTDLFFDFDEADGRGHSKKLFERRNRLDVRKYVFSNRIFDRWNSFSEDCVTCTALNSKLGLQ